MVSDQPSGDRIHCLRAQSAAPEPAGEAGLSDSRRVYGTAGGKGPPSPRPALYVRLYHPELRDQHRDSHIEETLLVHLQTVKSTRSQIQCPEAQAHPLSSPRTTSLTTDSFPSTPSRSEF